MAERARYSADVSVCGLAPSFPFKCFLHVIFGQDLFISIRLSPVPVNLYYYRDVEVHSSYDFEAKSVLVVRLDSHKLT